MPRVAMFQADAFSDRRFAGNPAAALATEAPLAPALMQAIAADGTPVDFVSRYFAPGSGIDEDPGRARPMRRSRPTGPGGSAEAS